MASFPHRARDLLLYERLILRTSVHCGGDAWRNNGEAFRRNAAARDLSDWSHITLSFIMFMLREAVVLVLRFVRQPAARVRRRLRPPVPPAANADIGTPVIVSVVGVVIERVECPFSSAPKSFSPRTVASVGSPSVSVPYGAGKSVNGGIPKDPFSMHYISVDDAIRTLVELGPGAQTAKFDVQAAYRNVPIHASGRHLLGMLWRGKSSLKKYQELVEKNELSISRAR